MILFNDLSEIDCAMIWWLGVDMGFRRYGWLIITIVRMLGVPEGSEMLV